MSLCYYVLFFFFFQAEDGIRDSSVTGVQTCALPISRSNSNRTACRPHPPARSDSPPRRAARRCDSRSDSWRAQSRSGERRVGEEGRTRGSPDPLKKKKRKEKRVYIL